LYLLFLEWLGVVTAFNFTGLPLSINLVKVVAILNRSLG